MREEGVEEEKIGYKQDREKRGKKGKRERLRHRGR